MNATGKEWKLLHNVYCTYYVTEISRGSEGKAYRERMDEYKNVVPFLPDGVAYVSLADDGSYVIYSSSDEVLAVGRSEAQMQRELLLLTKNITLINGVEYTEYYRMKEKENEANAEQADAVQNG